MAGISMQKGLKRKWGVDIMKIEIFTLPYFFQQKKGKFGMGKDLKGKELGKGISQRADGRYFARFTSKTGKRKPLLATFVLTH